MALSIAARNVLIEHLDGNGVQWVVPRSVKDPLERERLSARLNSMRSLLAHKLICFDMRERRPHHSYITEAGRYALAKALADWADALDRVAEHRDGLFMLLGTHREQSHKDSLPTSMDIGH